MATKPNIVDIRDRNKSKINLWSNSHKYIVVHYLGVQNADNPDLYGADGTSAYGGHFNITRDGTIYQAADYNAVLWQVGTAGGCYTQKHPYANNYSCIGIECSVCYDTDWYFTKQTEESLVKLVNWLMQDLGVDESHVLRHYDVVNKTCPYPYVMNTKHNGNMTWDEFKARLMSNNSQTGGSGYMFNCETVCMGSKGKSVSLVQSLLRAKNYKGRDGILIVVDGDAGNNTVYAIKSFQKSNGLTQDGIAGPITLKALIGL